MAPPPPERKSTNIVNCSKWGEDDLLSILEKEEALEEVVWNGFKMWHLIFLSISGVMCIIILICCCVKFRIPRTKQEIEGDYIRRQILRKFRQRLKAIQNQELDEMDLKKALDKIRAEFKSDTESLAQSDAGFSGATISSTGGPPPKHHGSYRRASQIQIDISLEELRAHSLGPKARLFLALSRLCGRSKGSQGDKVALTVDAEGEAQINVPEGAFKTKKKSGEDKGKAGSGKEQGKTEGRSSKEDEKSCPKNKGKQDKVKLGTNAEVQKTMEVKGQEAGTSKKVQKEDKKDPKKSKDEPKKQKADDQKQPKEDKKKDDSKNQSKDDAKKQKEDQKQKEKEEKDRKKAEKEAERVSKEKAKAAQTQLKIENEKAQKAQKEKVKEEKKKKEKADKSAPQPPPPNK